MIVMFMLATFTNFHFPWFLFMVFGGYLAIKYLKYLQFTDHPQSDEEEPRYLPSPREEEWLARRREKEYREVEPDRNWRDRDLV